MKLKQICIGLCLCYSSFSASSDTLTSAINNNDVSPINSILESNSYSQNQQAKILISATGRASIEPLKLLLSHHFNADAFDKKSHETAFMYAAYYNRLDMMDLLLNSGADINRADKIGDSAINWAAYGGKLEAVEWLLKRKVRLDLAGHGRAVEIAKRRGFPKIIELICQVQGCNTSLSVESKKMAEAIKKNDTTIVKALIKNGMAPEQLDSTGRPLFHLAARLGHTDIMKLMIAMGANINSQDDIGFTALMEASRNKKRKAVQVLLDAGADVNIQTLPSSLNFSVLHLAAIAGDQEIISLLNKHHANLNAQDNDGNTPAIWAIYEGDKATAKYMIHLGANGDLENKFGISANKLLKG